MFFRVKRFCQIRLVRETKGATNGDFTSDKKIVDSLCAKKKASNFPASSATALELATSGVTGRIRLQYKQRLTREHQSFQSLSILFSPFRSLSVPELGYKMGTKIRSFILPVVLRFPANYPKLLSPSTRKARQSRHPTLLIALPHEMTPSGDHLSAGLCVGQTTLKHPISN